MSHAVPFTRLDNAEPELLDELLATVERVAHAAAFSMGDELDAFEADFAGYCGVPHAVGVGSGTDALALTLRALGVGPGDEVIVPANSFIATAEAVSLVGATPRLVDVDPQTAVLTAEIVERNLGSRVRCVIPVHLYGRTVDLDPIVALAHEAGVAVVEDACQAVGALYKGRRVGTIGEAGCFSFYPAKNLGAWGDGGAMVSADPELADRVRLLRSHGERPRYRHRVWGTTSRLDALQAAILRVKLRRLERWNDDRRRVAASLTGALPEVPGLRPPAPVAAGGDHVYHLYVVRSGERDALRAHLGEEAVATGIHYPTPIHLTDAYAHLGMTPGSLPIAERLARTSLSLPLFPTMSELEVERVAAAVGEFVRYAAPAKALV